MTVKATKAYLDRAALVAFLCPIMKYLNPNQAISSYKINIYHKLVASNPVNGRIQTNLKKVNLTFCKKTKSPVKYFLIQGVILIHFAIFARNRIRDSRWVKEQKA